MADVQKTYGLVAIGFVLALLAGVTVWPMVISALYSSVGWAGVIIVSIIAFVPLLIAVFKPSLVTYLLFAVVTEGYALSVVNVYAYGLGPVVWGVVAGGAVAFAIIGILFSDREVGEGVGKLAFAAIITALLASLGLLVMGIFGKYSWHLDLLAAAAGFVGFMLFAVYDASKVRGYPDEYRAAVNLLIDMVGMVVELLRLVWLLQRRE